MRRTAKSLWSSCNHARSFIPREDQNSENAVDESSTARVDHERTTPHMAPRAHVRSHTFAFTPGPLGSGGGTDPLGCRSAQSRGGVYLLCVRDAGLAGAV